MGWFSKREPVYSELGQRLFELMTEFTHEWDRHIVDYAERVNNNSRKVTVWGYLFDRNRICLRIDGEDSEHLLTPDDHRRLRQQFLILLLGVVSRDNREQSERLSPAATEFDSTARSLAKAVLDGDKTAARALVDRCQELVQQGLL